MGCACDKSLSACAVPSSCLAVSVGVGFELLDQGVRFELYGGDLESLVGCACDESVSVCADDYLFRQGVKNIGRWTQQQDGEKS